MSSSPTARQEQHTLLKHLEGVFALAQVVAADAEEAVRLVEATYRKAFEDAAGAELSSDEQQVRLYRLLLQARTEATPSPETENGRPPELAQFRRRLAAEYVDQTLPTAFATLTSEQRIVLMLADVQDLEVSRLARVLDLDEAQARNRLDAARDAIQVAVRSGASDAERRLMDTGLPENWERVALRRMTEDELVALPPTLRPTILSSIYRPGSEVRSAEPANPSPKDVGSTSGRRRLLGGVAKRIAAIFLIVAVAGLLGYGFSSLMRQSPKANLITLSARTAVDVEANFQTTSAEQAERYVYDRLARRITVPVVARAAFQGVSIRSIADGAEVPVLVFEEAEGARVIVYVYSYAFLDRFQESLVVDRDVLRQIEEEGNFDLHDLGEEKALIWRRSDDILVAITAGDAEELRRRISYPA